MPLGALVLLVASQLRVVFGSSEELPDQQIQWSPNVCAIAFAMKDGTWSRCQRTTESDCGMWCVAECRTGLWCACLDLARLNVGHVGSSSEIVGPAPTIRAKGSSERAIHKRGVGRKSCTCPIARGSSSWLPLTTRLAVAGIKQSWQAPTVSQGSWPAGAGHTAGYCCCVESEHSRDDATAWHGTRLL